MIGRPDPNGKEDPLFEFELPVPNENEDPVAPADVDGAEEEPNLKLVD